MTVPKFTALKRGGQKITMLTAYDYAMARLLDAAGIEGILVGDTLSMVVQGHANTLPVTLDEMIYHAEMVGRAVERALLVVDLPFPDGYTWAAQGGGKCRPDPEGDALPGGQARRRSRTGGRDRGAGGGRHSGDGPLRTAAAKRAPVGRLQESQRDEQQLLADADAAEAAGAFAVVLECVPAALAAKITARSAFPRSASAPAPAATARSW